MSPGFSTSKQPEEEGCQHSAIVLQTSVVVGQASHPYQYPAQITDFTILRTLQACPQNGDPKTPTLSGKYVLYTRETASDPSFRVELFVTESHVLIIILLQ